MRLSMVMVMMMLTMVMMVVFTMVMMTILAGVMMVLLFFFVMVVSLRRLGVGVNDDPTIGHDVGMALAVGAAADSAHNLDLH
ncbi:MAG: hypothetical protein AAFU79_28510 [Myxococcota bacterium]